MAKNEDKLEQKFTKNVPLPSEGYFYDEDNPLSRGDVELKYPTAAEEDILTDDSLAQRGLTFDKFMKAIIMDDVDVREILSGDKAAIIIAARMLAYGEEYTFKARSQETGENKKVTINLGDLEPVKPDFDEFDQGQQEFEFELPVMDIPVKWKLLTHGDELSLHKELREQTEDKSQITTRLQHHIVELDGERDNANIRWFVKNRMLARDSRALRNRISEVTPNIDLSFEFTNRNGDVEELPIDLTPEFFFPSPTSTS